MHVVVEGTSALVGGAALGGGAGDDSVGTAGSADAAPATDRTIWNVSTDLWYYLRMALEPAPALLSAMQTIPSMTR